MRLAASAAIAAAAMLSACSVAREVDASTGGYMHAVPFVDAHTTSARAGMESCTVCHGVDYAGGLGPSCTACHQNPDGANFAGDWRTNCTFCHGGGSGGRDPSWSGNVAEAAPPQTVAGPAVEADQTNANPKVGAHQRHLVAGTYSAPLACDSCHAVPAQTFPESLQHVDGSVALQFSAFAQQGVTSPGYAGAGGSCAVYCHGSMAALGNHTSPAWTGTIACGSCHTVAPTSGLHEYHRTNGLAVACTKCHTGYSVADDAVDLAKHVNGLFEASIEEGTYTRARDFSNATPTWPTGSCTSSCHTSIPPIP